jgi:hypothetical protein
MSGSTASNSRYVCGAVADIYIGNDPKGRCRIYAECCNCNLVEGQLHTEFAAMRIGNFKGKEHKEFHRDQLKVVLLYVHYITAVLSSCTASRQAKPATTGQQTYGKSLWPPCINICRNRKFRSQVCQ